MGKFVIACGKKNLFAVCSPCKRRKLIRKKTEEQKRLHSLKRLKHCNKYTYFNILIFLLYIFARSG
jgi:hypothetical protein